jgi:hypothetical protein
MIEYLQNNLQAKLRNRIYQRVRLYVKRRDDIGIRN